MMGEAFYDATDITTEKSVKKVSSALMFALGRTRITITVHDKLRFQPQNIVCTDRTVKTFER